jgi:hypothetical protein
MSHYNSGLLKDAIEIPVMAYWSEEAICSMDSAFSNAMMSAIALGLERCAVGVNTAAGTKFPTPHYRRPD